MGTLLEIRNLALGYPDETLFRQLSLDLEAGTTLAVLGANGTGKSTFVKLLLGLIEPLAGRISWPQGKPEDIGYLAQLSAFDRRFPIRVRDLVAMGAWGRMGAMRALDADLRARVDAALEETGVSHIADRALHTLSGGQLQRALFARVILQDASLILLDEPFAAVDQTTEAHLLTLLDRWQSENRAVVLVVHDLSSVLDHCSHALLLGANQATHGLVDEVVSPQRLVAQGYLSPSQAEWMFRKSQPDPEAAHV